MRHSDVNAATRMSPASTPRPATDCGARRSAPPTRRPAGCGDEITHNLLTLVGDRIYFNTNLGLVAALDADSGEICWLHRYDGSPASHSRRGIAMPLHFDRDPSPCLYHDGLVIVAPSDTPDVFALDAEPAKLIWTNDQLADALAAAGRRAAEA